MKKVLVGVAVAALLSAAGCAGSAARAKGSSAVLRLGIFPNLTHAPGLVGIANGTFTKDLAPTKVKIQQFNSGSEASNALLAGSIDATYIGPGPTVSLFLKSGGKIAVVSGATQGGASFVVRTGAGINAPADLHNKKIASPATGNTQNIALRVFLRAHGLKAKDQGGDVSIVPLDSNSTVVQLFQSKQVDGAWMPEPYASLLVSMGLGTTFVDERALWPGGKFVTTNLLVSTGYMGAHPDVVKKLVKANVDAIQFIQQNAAQAQTMANDQIAKLGGKSLDPTVLSKAWSEMTFSWDPAATSLQKNAQESFSLGFITQDPTNILDVYKLEDLNAILSSLGLPAVSVTG